MLTPHRGAKMRPSLDEVQTPGTSSNPDNPPITVLPSSTELFFFYAQNLEQCAKLSTKGMLAEVFGVWGKWLRIYAGLLIAYRCYVGFLIDVILPIRGCLDGQHEKVNNSLNRRN